MELSRRQILCGTAGFALGASALRSQAQSYPSRPIRLVIPFPAGGPTDTIGRAVAQSITAGLGQPVVLDNRAGATGNIGADAVAKSAPDGYTLVIGNIATHAINSHVYTRMPYDPIKDFTPVCALIAPLMTVAVHPSVPANSIPELVAYAKANAGKLGYASSGIASPHHLAGALFCQLAGVNMVHVPYKGAAPAAVDLVGGQVPVGFITLSTALPFHKAGKIRILGMTEKTRTALLPDVPSISETVKGFEVTNWQGLFGPANLPPAIVSSLQAECAKGFNSTAIKSQMEAQGLSVIVDTSERFAALVRQENQKWGAFVKSLNVVLE